MTRLPFALTGCHHHHACRGSRARDSEHVGGGVKVSTDSSLGGVLLALGATARKDASDLERLSVAVDAAVLVEFTGRAGVGRSSLVAALGPVDGAEVVESAARDRPGSVDPVLTGDVVVLVVLDPPRDVDRAAAAEAAGRLVPVLAKTDTLTDPDRALARAASALAAPCLPVTTVGPDTGLPRLRAALDDRVRAIRAARAAELLSHLRTIADRSGAHAAVDEFLACDDGVRLAARATGLASPDGDAQTRARYWRTRMNTEQDPDAVRAAVALHRDAVREWARNA